MSVMTALAPVIVGLIGLLGFMMERNTRLIMKRLDGHDAQFSELRREMREEFGGVREEFGGVRGEIGALRGEMGTEIAGLRGEIAELRKDAREFERHVNVRFDALHARIDGIDRRSA